MPPKACRSLAPVIGPRPKVLILGSMPGERSLAARRYYAHPKNQFWELLGAALGIELRQASYESRLALLKRSGVALWDTIAECRRDGSLDASITEERPNDVAGLLKRQPTIRAVFCNGRKSYAMFRRHHASSVPPELVRYLPSSSPANASVPYPTKRREWMAIASYAGSGSASGAASDSITTVPAMRSWRQRRSARKMNSASASA